MKNTFLISLMTLILAAHFQPLNAQSIRDSSHSKSIPGVQIYSDSLSVIPVKKTKSHLEAGISYLNNDVYLGRKDSSVLPYYIPVLTFHHKSGLYFSTFVNYLSNAETSRIDLVTLEAGYIFNTGNYDGQFNISKFIYNSQSSSVTSEIQASAGYQNGFYFGVIKTFLNLNLDFGTRIDYTGSFGLEHGFTILNDKLEFTPGFCVNAGTQNFYDSYYKNKRFSNQKTGKVSGNAGSTVIGSVANPSHFKILDYEASIPLSYSINKLIINFTPTYAIPVNPSLLNIDTRQSNGNSTSKTVTEQLTNSFYMTIGVTFKFG
jgi:hypothetical protein